MTQEKFPVKRKFPFPKRPDAKRTLIDTEQEKFQENGALKHWADIQNLKIAAASYEGRNYILSVKFRSREICSMFVYIFVDIRRFCAYNINGIFCFLGERKYGIHYN